jgi:hypothetical protein
MGPRPWPDHAEALIEATDGSAILCNDIYDRDPLPRWSENRVRLLTDAAHPMTPNLGQGGRQAKNSFLCFVRNAAIRAVPSRIKTRQIASVAAYEALTEAERSLLAGP